VVGLAAHGGTAYRDFRIASGANSCQFRLRVTVGSLACGVIN
jgi:hypothetical protein